MIKNNIKKVITCTLIMASTFTFSNFTIQAKAITESTKNFAINKKAKYYTSTPSIHINKDRDGYVSISGGLGLIIKWDQFDQEDHYRISIRDLDEEYMIFNREKIYDSYVTVNGLTEGHEYKVWVGAFDKNDNQIKSYPIEYFKVKR